MLDENKFVEQVMKKYYQYNNRKELNYFYNTDIVRKIRMKKFVTMLVSFIILIGVISGTYAVLKDKMDIIQKQTELKIENTKDKKIESSMIYDSINNIYYKKIQSYDEYIEEKNLYEDIIEMKEKDFEDNFIIIFMAENLEETGLYIDDIEKDKENINIFFKINEKNDNRIIWTKVEKEYLNNRIKINIIREEPEMKNYTTKIKELPKDYSIDKAMEDNCIVLKDNKIISEERRLIEFIENTKKGIDDDVRVVQFNQDLQQNEKEDETIIDINYENGKYYLAIDRNRWSKPGEYKKYEYFISSQMEIESLPPNEIIIFEGRKREQISLIIER